VQSLIIRLSTGIWNWSLLLERVFQSAICCKPLRSSVILLHVTGQLPDCWHSRGPGNTNGRGRQGLLLSAMVWSSQLRTT